MPQGCHPCGTFVEQLSRGNPVSLGDRPPSISLSEAVRVALNPRETGGPATAHPLAHKEARVQPAPPAPAKQTARPRRTPWHIWGRLLCEVGQFVRTGVGHFVRCHRCSAKPQVKDLPALGPRTATPQIVQTGVGYLVRGGHLCQENAATGSASIMRRGDEYLWCLRVWQTSVFAGCARTRRRDGRIGRSRDT